MNNILLSRALGTIGHTSAAQAYHERALYSLTAANSVKFSYLHADKDGSSTDGGLTGGHVRPTDNVAHPAGVNTITIDKFEGRYLLSGGADASIAVWDLESATPDPTTHALVHRPLSTIPKSPTSAHTAGITHLAFYPHDSLAFLSSSYDATLALWDSTTLVRSASFALSSPVHHHATSPDSSLLVAAATQHPAVRLVDLRTANATHSLPGAHSAAVLCVAWHPLRPHILASGSADGSVSLWDVRRSASALGSLDRDDSLGVLLRPKHPSSGGVAHAGPVHGATFTPDGQMILTSGGDGAMRLWDAATGANTLVNYGPALRSGGAGGSARHVALEPLLVPSGVTGVGREVVLYPNARELLVLELRTGRLRARLRVAPEPQQQPLVQSAGVDVETGGRGQGRKRGALGAGRGAERTTALAWRVGSGAEVYSAHGDGAVRCWAPRTVEDRVADEEEGNEDDEDGEGSSGEEDGGAAGGGRKRRREALDELVAGLTGRKIGFT